MRAPRAPSRRTTGAEEEASRNNQGDNTQKRLTTDKENKESEADTPSPKKKRRVLDVAVASPVGTPRDAHWLFGQGAGPSTFRLRQERKPPFQRSVGPSLMDRA